MKKIRKSRLIVINDNKILVLKRTKPAVAYSIPGGIVKRNETSKEGLIREVAEEACARVHKKDMELLFSFSFKKKKSLVEKKYYLLKNSHKYKFKLKEKEKFDALVWIDSIELLRHMEAKEKLIIEAFILNSSLFYFNKQDKPL